MNIPIKMTVKASYSNGTPPPEYSGPTTIQPATTEQTLNTDNTWMKSNITVEAMPVYEGSYIFTPTNEPQVISTSQQYLLSDITINPIPRPIYPVVPEDAIIFYSASIFTLCTENQLANWDGIMYYSTDYETWYEWDGTVIEAALSGEWYKIYLKGEDNHVITGEFEDYESQNVPTRFKLTASTDPIKCEGNLTNLLNYTNGAIEPYGMSFLFQNNPDVDFDVELPNIMTDWLYTGMFYGCLSMTTAPELTHTTINEGAYSRMFMNCISLEQPPTISAQTVAMSGMESMFDGCQRLKATPDLSSITAIDEYAMSAMFGRCYSLQSTEAMPILDTLQPYCFSSMFDSCFALTAAPSLPYMNLAESCYQSMFANCRSLETAPELPAITLASMCYDSMFTGCSTLTTPPALEATNLASYCYANMFAYCTALNTLPQLNSTILPSGCYSFMFQDCTNIYISETQDSTYTNAYPFNASESANNSTNYMFYGTSGTFTGTPNPTRTYYTRNPINIPEIFV